MIALELTRILIAFCEHDMNQTFGRGWFGPLPISHLLGILYAAHRKSNLGFARSSHE